MPADSCVGSLWTYAASPDPVPGIEWFWAYAKQVNDADLLPPASQARMGHQV